MPATTRRNWLSDIKTDVDARPTAAIIYGVPGIGKTSMAAYAPGVVFLTDYNEDGITTLKASGFVPKVPQLPAARSWIDVLGMLDALATQDHQHKCLAIDALGGIERLCHEEVCRRDYDNKWGEKGFMSYQKGFDTALTDWRQFINALDRLRDERKMGILILAHAKVGNFKNPEGPDFDTWSPDCHKSTWSLTHKWADVVLFLNYTIVTDKDGKGQSSHERTMFTEFHAAYAAKNRHNLPPEIPMGDSGKEAWRNFREAIKQGKATNNE